MKWGNTSTTKGMEIGSNIIKMKKCILHYIMNSGGGTYNL